MKTDDDVYVNLPLLEDLVLLRPERILTDGEKIPMMGFLFINSPVLGIPVRPVFCNII
jgi:hypothetical protein